MLIFLFYNFSILKKHSLNCVVTIVVILQDKPLRM